MPPTPISPVSLPFSVYRGNGSTDLYNGSTGQKLSSSDTVEALRASGYDLNRIASSDAGTTPNAPNTPAPAHIATTTDQNAPTGSKLNAQGTFTDVNGNNFLRAPVQNTSTLTANVAPAQTKVYKAPASISSSLAKTDIANKNQTLADLHQNVTDQATATQQAPASPQTPTDNSIESILSELDKNLSLSQTNESTSLSNMGSQSLKVQTEADATAHAGFTKLQSISSGVYPLSATDNQMIESTKQSYQRALQDQTVANSGALGQMTELMASLGIQHSAPVQSMSLIQNVISTGTAKLADISTKMTNAVNKLQMEIQTKNYNDVQKAYQDMAKTFTARTDALQKMQTSIANVAKDNRTNMINYAKLSLTAIVNSNKASIEQKKNTATVAYENGLLSSKRYANITARIKANKPVATKPLSASQKTSSILRQVSDKIVKGAMLPDGTPVIDSNNYMTPTSWKYIIKEASKEGVSRSNFIKQFGHYIYFNDISNSSSANASGKRYGLSGSEVKLITTK